MSREDLGDGHQPDYYVDYLTEHGLRDGQPENEFEPDDPTPFPKTRFPPDQINAMHANSDVDSAQFAQHHTLGPRHNQAAPGDHSHDGVTSKNIGAWVEYVNNSNVGNYWICASGTNPSLGNGNVEARYCKIGTLCFVNWYMSFDTGSTFGTGPWLFVLPFTAKSTLASGANGICGSAQAYMNGPFREGNAFFAQQANSIAIATDGQGSFWQAGNPQAWAATNNYHLSWSVFYETAS
jgi:hypothetical protein